MLLDVCAAVAALLPLPSGVLGAALLGFFAWIVGGMQEFDWWDDFRQSAVMDRAMSRGALKCAAAGAALGTALKLLWLGLSG